ncbi:MAG TPA: lipopolysaccharide heptosyltransferase II [Verrucomicrobiae bacterium]|nr:lipopolysaccharide heptosyltransferase II [Verrucomicrobiae bacterium]
MKILVRSTNWLGDAVMTTPALLRLREKFPDAHITILTPEKLRELWLNHSAINEIVSIAPGETVFRIGKKLRPENFDLALALPNSPRAAIELYLAKIPKRIGYARPWRNFFLTKTIAPRAGALKMRKLSVRKIRRRIAKDSAAVPAANAVGAAIAPYSSAHQIHEYLNLAASLGANAEPLPPKLNVMVEEIDAVKKKFGLDKIVNPVFGLNPGAEYGPAKRWPIRRFVAAAQELQFRKNCVWILFGGPGDAALANQIQSSLRSPQQMVFNLAGRTTLRELMALLKVCRVLLTNDTGPMHVASALGVPVVVPFGSTSPELTGPVSANGLAHKILRTHAPCSPCFLRECPVDFRCMNGIEVSQVVDAVLETAQP